MTCVSDLVMIHYAAGLRHDVYSRTFDKLWSRDNKPAYRDSILITQVQNEDITVAQSGNMTKNILISLRDQVDINLRIPELGPIKKKHCPTITKNQILSSPDGVLESSSPSTRTCHYHAVGLSTARLLGVSLAFADEC